jgi:MFS family permease
LEDLIAFRILQGAGGAMMFPVGRLLLLRGVRKEELLSAMAWLTMPALLGPVCGPPLGGILTDLFGWRAVFWINVPIGLIGFLLVAWKIPAIPPTNPGKPDVLSLLLIKYTFIFWLSLRPAVSVSLILIKRSMVIPPVIAVIHVINLLHLVLFE